MSAEDTNLPPSSDGAPPSSGAIVWTPEQIRDSLRAVIDPDLHINIVDLGLVYEVGIQGDVVLVDMTLTSPGCPYGPYIIHQVKDTVANMKGVRDSKVTLVWDPPWGPDKMSEEVRLELGFDL